MLCWACRWFFLSGLDVDALTTWLVPVKGPARFLWGMMTAARSCLDSDSFSTACRWVLDLTGGHVLLGGHFFVLYWLIRDLAWTSLLLLRGWCLLKVLLVIVMSRSVAITFAEALEVAVGAYGAGGSECTGVVGGYIGSLGRRLHACGQLRTFILSFGVWGFYAGLNCASRWSVSCRC